MRYEPSLEQYYKNYKNNKLRIGQWVIVDEEYYNIYKNKI